MRILQFESVGGASGDMILGALIDLGTDVARLEQELRSLAVGEFRIEARPFSSHHLHGAQVYVHTHAEHHPHRTLKDIHEIISRSRLPEAAQKRAMKVFQRLAEVEANIHQTTTDQIHFHEVGAVDSILDITGACLALEWLGVQGVVVGPLPMGCGTISCAHGVYPNPPPATVELLKGFPIIQTGEMHELVTPTAAALLAEWKSLDVTPPGARVRKTGYGFGHRVLDGRPNLLRAMLLEVAPQARPTESCLVLECNVDDTTPELMGTLADRVLKSGALDVFTTAVQMKKQRPGMLLTVLCRPEDRETMLDVIFRECTTLGVREYTVSRTVLERRWQEVPTPYGKVRIKVGRWNEKDVTFSPEMDDCVQRAQEHQVPVRAVYESALQAAGSLRK